MLYFYELLGSIRSTWHVLTNTTKHAWSVSKGFLITPNVWPWRYQSASNRKLFYIRCSQSNLAKTSHAEQTSAPDDSHTTIYSPSDGASCWSYFVEPDLPPADEWWDERWPTGAIQRCLRLELILRWWKQNLYGRCNVYSRNWSLRWFYWELYWKWFDIGCRSCWLRCACWSYLSSVHYGFMKTWALPYSAY